MDELPCTPSLFPNPITPLLLYQAFILILQWKRKLCEGTLTLLPSMHCSTVTPRLLSSLAEYGVCPESDSFFHLWFLAILIVPFLTGAHIPVALLDTPHHQSNNVKGFSQSVKQAMEDPIYFEQSSSLSDHPISSSFLTAKFLKCYLSILAPQCAWPEYLGLNLDPITSQLCDFR